jgi:hypothetical protein
LWRISTRAWYILLLVLMLGMGMLGALLLELIEIPGIHGIVVMLGQVRVRVLLVVMWWEVLGPLTLMLQVLLMMMR